MKLINKKTMRKQQGIALILALIMLLLITVVGVASVRMTSLDTQVSGNSMFSLMVFQGAESALGKVSSSDDLHNIQEAAKDKTGPYTVPVSYFTPSDTVNGGSKLESTAEMEYEFTIPQGQSLYLSGSSGQNSNTFEYQIYRTTAVSKLDATAAKAEHAEGVAIQSATSN